MAPSITALVITLNEERHIAQCIASLRDADEIIVLDSGSTDRTIELARAAGAQVVFHPMTDFADQRNYGNSIAQSDWILHVDADERMSPAAWTELRSKVNVDGSVGFEIPRLNYILERPMHHGGWYPHYIFRVFRRGNGSWVGNVHETVEITGQVGRLAEPLIHFGHPDISTIISKLNTYTSLEAPKKTRPVFVLALLALVDPPSYFVFKYVIQAGALDGWRGFVIAALLAVYRCVSYLKAIECRLRVIPSPPA